MENITRTIYGQALQSALTLRLPYTPMQYTTLNEKLGIQASVAAAAGVYPTCNYFAIGNGGHTISTGADGIALPELYQHEATDAGLFNQMPFVLREVGNDIAPAERARYALRKEITIGSTTYIAYYLRRIDTTGVTVAMKNRNINAGVVTDTPFIATAANLTPVPTVLVNEGVNVTTGDYVTTTSLLPINFTAADVEEYLSAAEIIYGSRKYGIISEMALCSGVDKTIVVPASTGSFNFAEVIQVQINTFIADFHVMQYTTSGLNKILDVGSNSPLYNIS
jgi:hypothetical protein